MDKIISIFLCFFIALIATAVGRKIFKKLGIDFSSFLEELCFSLGLGFAVLSLVTFFLGILGLLYSWIFILLLGISFAVFFRELLHIYFIINQNLQKFAQSNRTKLHLVLLTILGVFFLFSFISALAPPTGQDALTYHLTVPKIFIDHHRIHYIPYILQSCFPLNIEMLYMLGILVYSDIVAKLFPFLFSLMTVLCIYSFGQKFYHENIGLYAAVLFGTMPFVAIYSGYADIGLPLAFYVTLSCYALVNWIESKDDKMFFTAAVLTGFCIGIKYTGLILVFLLILGVAYKTFLVEKKQLRTVLAKVFLAIFIVGIIGGPWYLRNYIDTGNPTYPYMNNIFGCKYLTSWGKEIITGINLNKFPLRFTRFLWGVNINTRWMTSIGPLYLFFIPCVLFLKQKSQALKIMLGYGLGCVLLYSLFLPEEYLAVPRFFAPFLLPWSIVCAYSYKELIYQDGLLKKILSIFIIFTISLALLLHIGKAVVKLPVVFGFEGKDQYLRSMINIYSAVEYVNHNLDDSCRIFLIGVRGYYFEKPFIIGPDYHGYINYSSFRKPQDFLNRLKELKITHILIDEIDKPRLFHELVKSNKNFLNPRNFALIYEGNNAYLYEVHY